MDMKLDNTLFDRASDNPRAKRRLEHLGKERDDVKLHCHDRAKPIAFLNL